MYPDTDSAPIPLNNDYIDSLDTDLPTPICERFHQLTEWEVPEDTHHYILKNNLVPIMEKIIGEFGVKPRFVGTFFGHQLKSIEGRVTAHPDFSHEKVYNLFGYVHRMKLDVALTNALLPIVTGLALAIGGILGGSIILEQSFSYPGIGLLIGSAIGQRDYFVISGAAFFMILSSAFALLIVDLVYPLIDPRVRYQ